MKIRKTYFLFVLFIVISLACNTVTNLPAGDTPQDAATKVPPPLASGNGPQGFSAEATSSDSVLLSWQPVDGASSYHVAVSTNDGETLTVIDLPATVTSYEDFLVSPDSQLTYAVEALGDTGSIGQSVVNVTTPARQPNPLQVLVEFDTSASVSQTIGPSGGSLSIVDSSGVAYELSVPPNALDEETEIKLVPIADLSDWPLDGEMIGVIGIEPEGLILNEPAVLTITPPSEISNSNLATIGFTFQGFGQEFSLRPVNDSVSESTYIPEGSAHLARPRAQFKDAVLQFLSELRPTGAGKASPPQIKELTKNNPPSDSVAAMDQKETASMAELDDLAPLPVFPWIRRYETFHRRIEQASQCGDVENAINYLIETRARADSANDQSETRIKNDNQAMDELIGKAKDVIDLAGQECKEKKRVDGKISNGPCALRLIRKIAAGATPIYKELQTRMQEIYGNGVLVDGQSEIQNSCKPGFIMSGGAANMKVNDFTCEFPDEFSVKGSVYGGAITLKFTPDSAEDGELPGGGTYSYVGSGAGVPASGNGTFIVSGSLETTVYIQAEGPGQAASESGFGSENYTLTPVEYGCGGG